MRFEYWKTADGDWAWHLKSNLGDIIARGMPARSRESCLTAIKLVKLAAAASCRELSRDDDGDAEPAGVEAHLVAGAGDPRRN